MNAKTAAHIARNPVLRDIHAANLARIAAASAKGGDFLIRPLVRVTRPTVTGR